MTPARTYRRYAPATLAQARALAADVGLTLREWGLPEHRVLGWELAVAEMATNLARHAYGDEAGQPPGPMWLDVTWGAEGLCMVLADEGEAFDPAAVPVPPAPDPADPDSWPESGMGLPLIRSAVDRLEYRTEGARNLMTLFVSDPTA